MNHVVAIIALILVVLTGCNEETPMFEEYKDMSSNTWPVDKTVEFEVEVEDSLNPHNMYLNIRNTVDYRYSNLFLFVKITNPTGLYKRDTVELRMAKDDGQWTGKESGSLVNNSFLYKKDVIFPNGGTYQVEIQHGMRDEELEEISAVGLTVKKSGDD